MKIIGSIFFIALLMTGCGNKNKLPNGILPQEKMQAIMWEMVSANEFLSGYVFTKDTAVSQVAESKGWYKKIFELHQTTKEQFEKSYAYYKKHPAVMQVLLDSLSNRQYKRDTLKKESPDSLRSLQRKDTLQKAKIDSLKLIRMGRKKIRKAVEFK